MNGPGDAAGAAALRIVGLRKSFGPLEVLQGIDLRLVEHEVVCLIGASGSGKSTLLRCVNLLEPIDEGRIFVEGEEITAPGVDVDRIRRRIGIVFQSFNLFPHMSVLDNVTLAPRRVLPAASAAWARISLSTCSAMSGCCFRNSLAFSRPCSSRHCRRLVPRPARRRTQAT